MDPYVVFALTTVAAIGLMLFFLGALFSVITALGNKQYVFGWLTLLFLPLSLVYCACNWQKAAYPGKMVFSGFALLLVSALIAWLALS